MRLMISGGGTGGHVYPALAVVRALEIAGRLDPQRDLLWVGSRDGIEKDLVERAGLPFTGISAGRLRGQHPLATAGGALKLGRGFLQSRRLLATYRPDVLFVTGGFVCAPVTLAARQARIPILIYLPDIEPGQAIKFLSRYASRVAVTALAAQRHFPPHLTVVTGYPVRPELYRTGRETAQRRLKLDPTLPTLLVIGGSQGARSLNRAIARIETLPDLLAVAQIIHLCGPRDAEWAAEIRTRLPEPLQRRYHLYPYLHTRISDAYVAADLIVGRAGASILGEIPAVGAPSILAPYPYSGQHQWANAHYLAEQGAAVIIADADLEDSLVKTALALLNDPERRAAMGKAARWLARPDAAQAVAVVLEELTYAR